MDLISAKFSDKFWVSAPNSYWVFLWWWAHVAEIMPLTRINLVNMQYHLKKHTLLQLSSKSTMEMKIKLSHKHLTPYYIAAIL